MRLKDQEVSKIIEQLQKKDGNFLETLSIGRLTRNSNPTQNTRAARREQECVLTDSTGAQAFNDRFKNSDAADEARRCLLHLLATDAADFLPPAEGEVFQSYLKRFRATQQQ